MRSSVLFCATALSLACGIELPAPTATPDTYAGFLKLSSQLTCEASLRCCGTICNLASDDTFYASRARTLDYLKRGLLVYSPQAARDCLAATQKRYEGCDAALGMFPLTACNNVLSPAAPAGSMCETGVSSCIPETTCLNLSCSLRRPSSQSCPSNSPTCTSESETCCFTCVGLCAANLRSGQTCSTSTSSAQCQSGYYCQQTMFKCTPYQEAGQSCDSALLCNPASGLVCLPTTKTCAPPQENGASCTSYTQCISGYCQLPAYPMLTEPGTCQPQPVPLTVRQQLCASK